MIFCAIKPSTCGGPWWRAAVLSVGGSHGYSYSASNFRNGLATESEATAMPSGVSVHYAFAPPLPSLFLLYLLFFLCSIIVICKP